MVPPEVFTGVKKKARRVGRASYAELSSSNPKPTLMGHDGRTGLEDLFVRNGCRRQFRDVSLLAVMETPAKGDGRGDDRKSKDGAHN
jgi:hypothetical protein